MNGRLQYKFDCGSGPGVVPIHSPLVNDGEWHTVSLEVDGNYARLVLDRTHTASGKAQGNLRTLNLDTSVFFGGHVWQAGVANGLRGCLQEVVLNGRELPLRSQPRSAHSVLEELVEAVPGCSPPPRVSSCTSEPCANGGTCTELPNGGTGSGSADLDVAVRGKDEFRKSFLLHSFCIFVTTKHKIESLRNQYFSFCPHFSPCFCCRLFL